MNTENQNRSQEPSPTTELVGVDVPRLVRRCPACGHGRWRHVGEIARVGISTSGKAWREVDMKIIECMKCDHSWDILTEAFESGPTNTKLSDLSDNRKDDNEQD